MDPESRHRQTLTHAEVAEGGGDMAGDGRDRVDPDDRREWRLERQRLHDHDANRNAQLRSGRMRRRPGGQLRRICYSASNNSTKDLTNPRCIGAMTFAYISYDGGAPPNQQEGMREPMAVRRTVRC